MSSTLKDIAIKTGVSVSTVSRVLHDKSKKYKISPETQAKIKAAASESGYRVNTLARGLRTQKTFEIGVVVPNISNPFFAAVIKSLADELRKQGYSITVYDSDEDIAIEHLSIRRLLEKRIDGLLIASVGKDFSYIQKIHDAAVPFVLIDRCSDELEADAVSVDNVKGSLLALNHLIKKGHRRIAFIQGLPGTYANQTRLKGYKSALTMAGIKLDEKLIVGNDFRSLNGYEQTKHLLKLKKPPTAIFTAGELIALGVLQACREIKVKIPRDLSLITFDDPVFASYLSPPLSTVEQPIIKIAETAVKILYERMRNPESARQKILLEPRLIERSSIADISKGRKKEKINNR